MSIYVVCNQRWYLMRYVQSVH